MSVPSHLVLLSSTSDFEASRAISILTSPQDSQVTAPAVKGPEQRHLWIRSAGSRHPNRAEGGN